MPRAFTSGARNLPYSDSSEILAPPEERLRSGRRHLRTTRVTIRMRHYQKW